MIKRRSPRLIARLAGVVAAAAMIMTVMVPSASAHIRVSAVDAAPGGDGLLTFRVPTESDTASTTEIVISFPTSTPITSVSVSRVPGWKATIKTARLDKPIQTDDGPVNAYVTRVDWRAESAKTAIKPGEFGLFNLSAGPLPHAKTVLFPTDQHYSDGTVVSWNQVATGSPGSHQVGPNHAEPDHPAPALQLATGQPTPTPAAATAPAGSSSNTLGLIGIILGVVAVVIATIALLRGRRPTA